MPAETKHPGAIATIPRDAAPADHDLAWLEACFDTHGAQLRRIAAAHVGADSADDAVSETFAIAWSTRKRFDPSKGTERDWLVGILVNRCRSVDRTERRWRIRTRRSSRDIVAPVQDPATEIVDKLDAQGQHQSLVARVNALPSAQRTVLLLVAIGEMSTAEISTALQIKHSTVRSHLRRARRSVTSAPTELEDHDAGTN